jgi:hypothetical protein
MGGNMDEYARFLIAEYGAGILLELGYRKRETVKANREFFEQVIARYA